MRIVTSLALLGALSCGLAGVAFARDSTWMLCKGKASMGDDKVPVLVNLLEHRAEDGSSRDLEVTLIYGDRVSRGTVKGKDGSDATAKGNTVKLVDTSSKATVIYDGGAVLSEDFKALTLKGKADQFWGDDKPTPVPFSAKLKCEEIDNP
jgi:hypothetical protein